MNNCLTSGITLGAVCPEKAKTIDALARAMEKLEQVDMEIEHHLHAGVYSRTLMQPAGVLCVAAMLKIPTQLIVSGHCRILCGDKVIELDGYNVIEGVPGRQIVVYTITDTWATAFFATNADTVEEAEREAVGDENLLRLTNHKVKELLK